MHWKIDKRFGDVPTQNDIEETDEISSLAYSPDGSLLAVGDCGGRIVLFRDASEKSASYSTEFQGHDETFDVLSNRGNSPEVTSLNWCHWGLLSSNHKTMKLWNTKKLRKPKLKQTFKNVHVHPIHSVHSNSDGATVLSADNLQIYMWSLETSSSQAFLLYDMTPSCIASIQEAITTTIFHPQHCYELLWGTTKGSICIADLRCAPRVTSHKTFSTSMKRPRKYDGITKVISDACYLDCGTKCLSRDYVDMTLWDTRFEAKPIHTWPIQESLRSSFDFIYDIDAMYHRFRCSATRIYAVTGTYANTFAVFNLNKLEKQEKLYHATTTFPLATGTASLYEPLLHVACNPKFPSIVAATQYNLYFFKQ